MREGHPAVRDPDVPRLQRQAHRRRHGQETHPDHREGRHHRPHLPAPAPLTGTDWRITTLLSGSSASSLPAGTEKAARIAFGRDGTVHGTLGCNSFRGKAAVNGSAVTFGPLVTTRKMCPDPEMRLERALRQVLDGKHTTYRIDRRTLSLTAQGGKGLGASAAE
ncbi:META domain-containing protein [Streptomyces sp. RKAG290]|uniref:META domain-containing protein n=1 Tax=Streptomyces sp. RKAG290 TaxID=2888348 RepID=UPI0027E2873A|nr:META domain-containing protein [Streptomyces sp. RKAG290]